MRAVVGAVDDDGVVGDPQVVNRLEQVADVAVVGVPSDTWGETPVAFVVAAPGGAEAEALKAWANERLGKTQRLAGVRLIEELPRSDIGKVLKRELRERWLGGMSARRAVG